MLFLLMGKALFIALIGLWLKLVTFMEFYPDIFLLIGIFIFSPCMWDKIG